MCWVECALNRNFIMKHDVLADRAFDMFDIYKPLKHIRKRFLCSCGCNELLVKQYALTYYFIGYTCYLLYLFGVSHILAFTTSIKMINTKVWFFFESGYVVNARWTDQSLFRNFSTVIFFVTTCFFSVSSVSNSRA